MSKPEKAQTTIGNIKNRGFLRLLKSLFLSLVATAVLGLLFCGYALEKNSLGKAWEPNLERRIEINGKIATGFKLFGVFGPTESLVYSYGLPGQLEERVDARPFFQSYTLFLFILALTDSVLLVFQHRAYKRELEPLRRISRAADELGRVKMDEAAFKNLEKAIEKLSVTAPEDRLQTGDESLAGLENAVNTLMSRLHENYRRQIRFVSDASHELRTPISVIRGYAELLSRWGKADPKVMEEAIGAIRLEADNMQKLVEQLLFLARGDAGRNLLTLSSVDLSLLVRETKEEYAIIAPQFVWRLKTEERLMVFADAGMLKQSLRILADNAMKYSKRGGIITFGAKRSPQGFPCFYVQDNGCGISAQDIPHVFERFYRAEPTLSKGGSGLGLAIAKAIADQHGAYIEVLSREGMGTRMTLVLPQTKNKATAHERA